MPTFKELKKKINACAGKQTGKALFGFFMLSMLETAALSVFLMPVLLVSKTGRATIPEMAVTAVSLYAGFIVVLVLQYGYHVLIARLVRGEFVTLGFLFNGFRDKKRVSRASLLYAAGLSLSLMVCQAAAYLFDNRISTFTEKFGMPVFAICVVSIFLVLAVAILVKFTFVWLSLYDDPSLNALGAFKRSVRLLHKRTFKLIGFVLYAGGRRLLVAAGIFIITAVLPASATSSGAGSVLGFMLDFVYFVAAYSAVVRMFMALPIFYDAAGGRPVKPEHKEEHQELSAPVIQLPGPSDNPESKE